jgi:hypothetical protein
MIPLRPYGLTTADVSIFLVAIMRTITAFRESSNVIQEDVVVSVAGNRINGDHRLQEHDLKMEGRVDLE